MYKAVLRNELLGTRIDGLHQNGASNGVGLFSSGGGGAVSGSNSHNAGVNGMNMPIAANGTNLANTMPGQTSNLIGANANMQTNGGANVILVFIIF